MTSFMHRIKNDVIPIYLIQLFVRKNCVTCESYTPEWKYKILIETQVCSVITVLIRIFKDLELYKI